MSSSYLAVTRRLTAHNTSDLDMVQNLWLLIASTVLLAVQCTYVHVSHGVSHAASKLNHAIVAIKQVSW